MTALADLQTRIADEINRTDATSQIALAISTAVKAYKFTRLAFNESSSNLSTADGTVEYDSDVGLPTDIIELDTARITVNGNRYLLEPVTYPAIECIDTSSTSKGQPSLYAWHEEKLRLYPVPDGVYVITLRYLANVGEETWCSRAEALIRSRAKRELYTHLLFDPQSAAIMAQAEREELAALRREARMKQSSGRIRPHD